jgi:hypothetical protein
MVHALEESWRVLAPGGVLIDIRPYSNNPALEILSGQAVYHAGQIDDSLGLPIDLAADHAVQTLVARGAFLKQHEARFPLAYYWHSLLELQTYILEKWADSSHLPEEVLKKAQARVAVARGPIQIRIQREMLIARYQKVPRSRSSP